ncbi:MAG: hypothetical protein ACREL7_16560 [Longimicrobiales bacterium]
MGRYGGRNLDPTALYAAVMTVACLLFSTYPGRARAGAGVVAASETKCMASSIASPSFVPVDSLTLAIRSSVLGSEPHNATDGR